MGSVAPVMANLDEALSPRQTASAVDKAMINSPNTPRAVNNALDSIRMRADPDAQATVTDFLDFTEYLPSDMTRSLTLIGKLDQTYHAASTNVHGLTTKWQHLPSLPAEERPVPVQLRAEISENLSNAVSARVYSHAEASRMADNVAKHYTRAKTILTKLKTMMDNWPPPEEQKSPVATRSPQMTRAPKITLRADGQRVRRQQVPRITVPGEVLAPYELNYEIYGSGSESSSEEVEDAGSPPHARTTPAPQPRIKLVKAAKPPKTPKTPKPRISVPPPSGVAPELSTSKVLAKLQPPPDNVVAGSADAPWLQLTTYELAKLRKRMKKNAAWAPSDTMISRELKILGRGVEQYKAARHKAEEEGRSFDDYIPSPILDGETGATVMPPGALSMEAMAAEEKSLITRGMKPKEGKKSKRAENNLAKLAAEEAEASARKMMEAAKAMFTPSDAQSVAEQPNQSKQEKTARQKKRKRDSVAETDAEKPDSLEAPTQRPHFKRTKTETPVPHPQLGSHTTSQPSQETQVQTPHLAPGTAPRIPRTTPVPVPIPGQDQSAKSQPTVSPASTANAPHAATVPVKPPAETPVPAPVRSPRESTTPILPPIRETRKSQAARLQEQQAPTSTATPSTKPPSRGATPAVRPATPGIDPTEVQAATSITAGRRPGSRGLATSQEPQPSLAADRPRRSSTARNTPAPPETLPSRPVSRRQSKRPAPGVISRTNSGGNSAVGRRKAAPKKRSAAASKTGGKKDKGTGGAGGGVEAAGPEAQEVEIDDEGKVVDPNEPRYCLCNRVSFGMMLACDNDVSTNNHPLRGPKAICIVCLERATMVAGFLHFTTTSGTVTNANPQNCKQEWFHLECVGLSDVPARTTKWYCPDCRVALNIGERGEVNARGVRT